MLLARPAVPWHAPAGKYKNLNLYTHALPRFLNQITKFLFFIRKTNQNKSEQTFAKFWTI